MTCGFGTRLWLSVLGSFAVYLMPLVGPHAVWLFGEEMFRELTSAAGREALWIATDVGFAIAVQIVAALVLAWALGGSWGRLLIVPATLPFLFLALNTAYLVAIPSWFLIGADTEPEHRTWAEHCVVPHLSLLQVRTPVGRTSGGVREWWTQGQDGRSALLRVPGCEVIDAKLPQPTLQPGGRVDFMIGLQFAVPGGSALAERIEVGASSRSWWLLREPGAPLTPIASLDPIEGAPILASGSDAVAWLQRVEGSGPPILERVRIRRLEPRAALADTVIELAPHGAASYTLLGVDTTTEEVVLWKNDSPLVVGFGGERRPSSPFGSVRAQASTYARHGDGWLAWDAYKEQGAYEVAWSLPAGSGQHRLAKGRAVTSAALDPTATLIAVSATTTLSIGSAPDVVFVLRARDGRDVFRAHVSRYSRSPVVFFEGGFFGYSDEGGVHILKTPDPVAQ